MMKRAEEEKVCCAGGRKQGATSMHGEWKEGRRHETMKGQMGEAGSRDTRKKGRCYIPRGSAVKTISAPR
jgi:hypothetical protein